MDPIEPWVDSEALRRMANALLAAPPGRSGSSGEAAHGDNFIGSPGEAPKSDRGAEQSASAVPRVAPAPTVSPVRAVAPEGSPIERQARQARQALALARSIAQRGGLLAQAPPDAGSEEEEEVPVPPAAPPAQLTPILPVAEAAPVAVPASPPFVARLQAYGAWLREGLHAKAFFITDRDGGVLIDEVHSPRLQQVARTLAQASRTANRQAGTSAVGSLHVKLAPEAILEVVPVTTSYGPLILGILVEQPISLRNAETVALGLRQVIDGTCGG